MIKIIVRMMVKKGKRKSAAAGLELLLQLRDGVFGGLLVAGCLHQRNASALAILIEGLLAVLLLLQQASDLALELLFLTVQQLGELILQKRRQVYIPPIYTKHSLNKFSYQEGVVDLPIEKSPSLFCSERCCTTSLSLRHCRSNLSSPE